VWTEAEVQIPRYSQQPENRNSAKSGASNFLIYMFYSSKSFSTLIYYRKKSAGDKCLIRHSLPGGRIDMVEVSANVAGAKSGRSILKIGSNGHYRWNLATIPGCSDSSVPRD
jgi:hypothetical protein